MPFALIIVAIIAITVGLRGTQDTLYNLLKQDFTGPGNFFFWLVSVLVIGALGYIKTLKPFSDALLLLLVLVLFLGKDRGFFTQFNQALASTQNASGSSAAVPAGTVMLGGGSWQDLSGALNQGASALKGAFSGGGGEQASSSSSYGDYGGGSDTGTVNQTTTIGTGAGNEIVGPSSLKDFFPNG